MFKSPLSQEDNAYLQKTSGKMLGHDLRDILKVAYVKEAYECISSASCGVKGNPLNTSKSF